MFRSRLSRGPSSDGPLRFSPRGPEILAAAFLAVAAPVSTPTPRPGPALENTRWSLVALGDAAVPAGAPESYILFRSGGGSRRLGGATGCGGLKGSWDAFVGRLRIRATVRPAASCPDPVAARETKLLEALGATANYRIAGEALTLLGVDGRTLARFVAAPKP